MRGAWICCLLSSAGLVVWGFLYYRYGLHPSITAFGPAAPQLARALVLQRLYLISGGLLGLTWVSAAALLWRVFRRRRQGAVAKKRVKVYQQNL